MANVLSADKQIAIIGSLCEGSSIRSIERIPDVHRDTIMQLGVRVVTVLHTDPVTSQLLAVRGAIVQEFRDNASAEA